MVLRNRKTVVVPNNEVLNNETNNDIITDSSMYYLNKPSVISKQFFFKGGNEYRIYTISSPYNGITLQNQTQRTPYIPCDDLPPKYEDLADLPTTYPKTTLIMPPASTVTSTV